MFGIGRGQPKVSRGWAEVGGAVLRMDSTEYTLVALVVASISMGFAVLLGWRFGWRFPQMP
jgi:hypothetical protein